MAFRYIFLINIGFCWYAAQWPRSLESQVFLDILCYLIFVATKLFCWQNIFPKRFFNYPFFKPFVAIAKIESPFLFSRLRISGKSRKCVWSLFLFQCSCCFVCLFLYFCFGVAISWYFYTKIFQFWMIFPDTISLHLDL